MTDRSDRPGADLRREAGSAQLGQSALTPLLDVLFLLLFALLATAERDALVGATGSEASSEVRIRLPEVAADPAAEQVQAAELRLTLVVEADGTVSMSGAGDAALAVPGAAVLEQRLAAVRAAANPGTALVVEVRADADARHAVVVDVLQTLWSSGVADVRFVAAIDRDARTGRGFGGGPR